jgi:hypothetical protein
VNDLGPLRRCRALALRHRYAAYFCGILEGRGLVAVAPITKDEIVAIKGGHIVDAPTLHSLPERLRNSDVQIADGFHLVALDETEYEPRGGQPDLPVQSAR